MSRHSASIGNPFTADFSIADHGSIVSIVPVSATAREWLDANLVIEPRQWIDSAVAVHHRRARKGILGRWHPQAGDTQWKHRKTAVEHRMSALANPGFCLACGIDANGVEPDAATECPAPRRF